MHRELDLYPNVDQAIVLLTEGRKESNCVVVHLTSFRLAGPRERLGGASAEWRLAYAVLLGTTV